MHYNKVSSQELLDYFDNDLKNDTWNLEHNAETLQEILNRIMQRIMNIITSVLPCSQIYSLADIIIYFRTYLLIT